MRAVYSALAPSVSLPVTYDEYRASVPYPVSMPPDAKLTVADIARAMYAVQRRRPRALPAAARR